MVAYESTGGKCPGCGGDGPRMLIPGEDKIKNFFCEACVREDVLRLEQREASELEQERIRRVGHITEIMRRAGVNVAAYGDATLDRFDRDPDSHALRAVREFLAGDISGLYLYSRRRGESIAPGNGKTFLAVAALREILLRPYVGEHQALFVSATDIVHLPWQEVRRLAGARWLFIDDLGKEQSSDWSLEKMFKLVDDRAGKRTFYTSNYSLGRISERGDTMASVASRIAGNCAVCELRGPDRRIPGPPTT